jgi:hypothetical protein
MDYVMFWGAIVLALGVLVSTIIYRYATTRTVRVMTLIIAAIISVPLLVVALIVLLGGGEPVVKMWALGVCGLLFGYWAKSPFKLLQD